MGRLSHTKYILKDIQSRVKVTRRYHPLLNQELEVLKADKSIVFVRMSDGSALKIPRGWTNADGEAHHQELSNLSVFTVDSLRELMDLVDILKQR